MAKYRSTLEDLVSLPGVGRKTANVVLGDAFGTPGITVDTHVGRLSRRLGLTQHEDPVKVEFALMELLPQTEWTAFSHRLILHGRAGVSRAQAVVRDMRARGPVPQDRGEAGRKAIHRRERRGRRGRKRVNKNTVSLSVLSVLCGENSCPSRPTHCSIASCATSASTRRRTRNRTTYPSSPGQLVLGKMLRDELLAMGLKDAVQNEHGIVFATVPGNVPGAPTIAFNAHVDTNPENSGKNVNPQVIRNYTGGDIVLPKDPSKVIRVSENPDLNAVVGKTIITTDGTTLLGADDKAGVAVIMEAARILVENPSIPHGPVRIVFTCDEEIGFGVKHLEPAQIGAVVAYTLDGMASGEIEDETFSADAATVTITGVNIHPSIAKGRMINAVRLAGMFLDRLPKRTMSPETTDGRDGFLHPLTIEGGTGEVKIGFLLRSFDTAGTRGAGRNPPRDRPAG